jgi:hypothetical protein
MTTWQRILREIEKREAEKEQAWEWSKKQEKLIHAASAQKTKQKSES